ncbi:SRPBCC family protein [Flavilitoribacter nigricans]|uniref:ATPase n=1 Tax=Flavilitoribacter nigricans (strain ATCC 23147 / DSM 23189 / NBRC 102662 / NCIMB 1420 / SS-2) TaxID=1122177 RepID=A0A2D0N1U2_FLAN2|nr:SRPBCC domain-containing protein [Flavilitoribacter nigricans]PHN02512.1 ATPase [Flavilitoribacter nigricans DSM 23189 = NBRC 102662]
MKADTVNAHSRAEREVKDFVYSFISSGSPEKIFELLPEIESWWSGLYEETISGESGAIGDEFSFLAGGGAHYSKHRLVELVPGQKIVWEVIESNLSFLTKSDEWVGTHIRFDLEPEGSNTRVTFTHQGLTPKFECYGNCSDAWTRYLENLEKKLS